MRLPRPGSSLTCLAAVVGLCVFACGAAAEEKSKVRTLESALRRAGKNRSQLDDALKRVEGKPSREGLEFLITYMPDRDLTTLKADFLVENVEHCYEVWSKVAWRNQVPKEIFLNDVLPYVSINERRDNWRKDFYERFHTQVKDAKTPSEAAVILNKQVFPTLKVKYSTRRSKPDQSPYESMESGLASCSGLSILLVDACRAVGVPARFAGTALWSDRSGNHSWVEVWDKGWHFTGACEPTGDKLDQAWFLGRASKAKKDHPYHAIFATSYKHTPQRFPLVWNRSIDYVHAVNVTDRYTRIGRKIPADQYEIMIVVDEGKQRVAADLKVLAEDGKQLFTGKSHDGKFDTNDHLRVLVPKSAKQLSVVISWNGGTQKRTLKELASDKLFRLQIPKSKPTSQQK